MAKKNNTGEFKFQETYDYIKAVEEYLVETFGKVRDSWKPQIRMLGDEHDLYLMAKADIAVNGIVVETSRGVQQNPSVKVMQDASIQKQKIITALGLSPAIEVKLKISSPANDEESDDDLIKNLING